MKPLAYRWLQVRAVVWLWINRPGQALACFDRMARRYPDERYPRASRAHEHARARRFEEALADLVWLTGQYPGDATSWFNAGFVLEQLDRHDEALAAFQHATAIDPDLDRAWYGQGLALIRLQRMDEAAEALRRNTELQPMSPHGWYQLARVQIERKQPGEAVKIIRRLRGFEPRVAAQLVRETGLMANEWSS